MTDLDSAERKALFILFMQNHIDKNSSHAAAQLNSEYHSQIPRHLLEAAFQKWSNEGFAKTDHSGSAPKFRLRRDKFAEAYRRVLELYGASTITIYPDTREILSDIDPEDDLPMKEGWKWLTYDSEETSQTGAVYAHNQRLIPAPPPRLFRFGPIDWTKWGAILVGISILVSIVLWKLS